MHNLSQQKTLSLPIDIISNIISFLSIKEHIKLDITKNIKICSVETVDLLNKNQISKRDNFFILKKPSNYPNIKYAKISTDIFETDLKKLKAFKKIKKFLIHGGNERIVKPTIYKKKKFYNECLTFKNISELTLTQISLNVNDIFYIIANYHFLTKLCICCIQLYEKSIFEHEIKTKHSMLHEISLFIPDILIFEKLVSRINETKLFDCVEKVTLHLPWYQKKSKIFYKKFEELLTKINKLKSITYIKAEYNFIKHIYYIKNHVQELNIQSPISIDSAQFSNILQLSILNDNIKTINIESNISIDFMSILSHILYNHKHIKKNIFEISLNFVIVLRIEQFLKILYKIFIQNIDSNIVFQLQLSFINMLSSRNKIYLLKKEFENYYEIKLKKSLLTIKKKKNSL